MVFQQSCRYFKYYFIKLRNKSIFQFVDRLKLSTNSKIDLLQGLMKSQWKLFWNIVKYLQIS